MKSFNDWYTEKVALSHDSRSDAAKAAWKASREEAERELNDDVKDAEIKKLKAEIELLEKSNDFYINDDSWIASVREIHGEKVYSMKSIIEMQKLARQTKERLKLLREGRT
jgi:vancomycin resistance protein YoaR